jgi:regulator of cell morphogenesis and NO signaling
MVPSRGNSSSAQDDPWLATVASRLASDHTAHGALIEEMTRLAARGELERAENTLAALGSDVAEHMRFEEEVLFPVFEQHTGLYAGPTRAMRREHANILGKVDDMAAALHDADTARFTTACGELRGALSDHNRREQHVLYPVLDFVFDPEERANLLRGLRRD